MVLVCEIDEGRRNDERDDERKERRQPRHFARGMLVVVPPPIFCPFPLQLRPNIRILP